MSGRLVVCPTPIGNLEDVTLRVLAALRAADLVACEDTRHTRKLLDRYGVTGALVSYHEHNERERAGELVARMRSGAVVALVSDSGMPLVSDPGFILVQACIAAGLSVEVLPGPSSALAALVASGLAAERWRFVGFLPRKKAELEKLVVGTQLHEEVRRGSAAEIGPHYEREPPRGEVVLVVAAAPPGAGAPDMAERALHALRALVDAGARPRPAAKALAELTGVPANRLYRALTAGDGAERSA